MGKPMWRIGIALISQCDARYFAGDADVIDRHRLKLGCDSSTQSLRVQLQRQVQSIPDLNTTAIIWTCRSDLPLESDFRHSIPELDWSGLDRLEQYSPQWLLTRAVINWSGPQASLRKLTAVFLSLFESQVPIRLESSETLWTSPFTGPISSRRL
ncbi:hypothetical protein PGTUg99_012522, partial [Puccinia graminis f. sp. tritici]